MANLVPSLPALCTLLLLLCFSSGGTLKLVDGQAPGHFHLDTSSDATNFKAWCVAKPTTPDNMLIQNINYACTLIDCSSIKEGGLCYLPQTPINHASVAMNAYYQSQGKHSWNCDFNGTGIISITDPSFGPCKFQFNQIV